MALGHWMASLNVWYWTQPFCLVITFELRRRHMGGCSHSGAMLEGRVKPHTRPFLEAHYVEPVCFSERRPQRSNPNSELSKRSARVSLKCDQRRDLLQHAPAPRCPAQRVPPERVGLCFLCRRRPPNEASFAVRRGAALPTAGCFSSTRSLPI